MILTTLSLKSHMVFCYRQHDAPAPKHSFSTPQSSGFCLPAGLSPLPVPSQPLMILNNLQSQNLAGHFSLGLHTWDSFFLKTPLFIPTHTDYHCLPVNLLLFQAISQVLSFSIFFSNLQKELGVHSSTLMSPISCLVTLFLQLQAFFFFNPLLI